MALLDPQNNRIVLFILMIALFLFIMSNVCNGVDNFEALENTETKSAPKLDLNRCSKQCCAQTQWTLPPELRINDMTPEEASKYIPNNFSCNLGSGSGCLCVTKNDFNYLAERGNNSPNNTCSK